MSDGTPRFDVVILGSGFAGSLVALILAKSGLRVALVDRAVHPRFAIGESSTPAADYLLDQLCDSYELDSIRPLCRYGSWIQSYPEIRRGCKRGFSYIWHGSGGEYRPSDSHECELMVAASPADAVADTQWYRPDVDQFFYKQAIEHGVAAFVPAEACGFHRKHREIDDRVWQVDLRIDDQAFSIEANFIVDASGPGSRFLAHVGVADVTDSLKTNTAAVYTHFSHMASAHDWLRENQAKIDDFPYHFDKAAVHHLFHDGWLWQIGFDGDKTSVGFVSHKRDQLLPNTKLDAHELWSNVVLDHPVLQSFFANAVLDPMPGRFYASKRLQRLADQGAGDGWAALPFTVGFVDPLHSTGIAHSLSGVARICNALATADAGVREQSLSTYSVEVVEEIRHIDSMISGCYEGLVDFKLFNCWTMIYFAAATTFERQHRSGNCPSFLLAGDSAFREIVDSCRGALEDLIESGESCSPKAIDDYIQQVRQWIQPYNQVGLFSPSYPNMYYHTVAEKQ